MRIHQIYRYAADRDPTAQTVDGYPSFFFHTASPGRTRVTLEAGINLVARVSGPDGIRVPAILLGSSPHKIGSKDTPWQDFFNPDEYESIRTKAKLYTDLTSLLSELNRDLVVESQSRRMEGPTFLGEGSHIVEVLVDLAEIDHKVISRYWSTKRRNFISPIYSEFLIQCEERGIPTGEPRIKNYRVISRIYGNPVLSKIASQLARLLEEGVDGMSPMTLRQLVEDLIGDKPVLKYSTPSTEQILALLDLAKDGLTPEEYRGYTMLLKVKDKVI